MCKALNKVLNSTAIIIKIKYITNKHTHTSMHIIHTYHNIYITEILILNLIG